MLKIQLVSKKSVKIRCNILFLLCIDRIGSEHQLKSGSLLAFFVYLRISYRTAKIFRSIFWMYSSSSCEFSTQFCIHHRFFPSHVIDNCHFGNYENTRVYKTELNNTKIRRVITSLCFHSYIAKVRQMQYFLIVGIL